MAGDLAEMLLAYRFHRALTQEDLARSSGLSTRTISDLECGRVLRPRISTLTLLAKALDLSGDARTALFTCALAARVRVNGHGQPSERKDSS